MPFADVGPIKVPDSVTDEQALFLSDIFPTGYMAAVNAQIQPGESKNGVPALLQGDYDDADSSNNDFGGESCHFCHRLMPDRKRSTSATSFTMSWNSPSTNCRAASHICRQASPPVATTTTTGPHGSSAPAWR